MAENNNFDEAMQELQQRQYLQLEIQKKQMLLRKLQQYKVIYFD